MFFHGLIYFSVHKYIFQCTNAFFSAQIYFSVHKFIFKCTNLFFSAQIYFQCTNICFSVHEYVSVHKHVFQCTIIFSKPGYRCLPAPNWLPFCITKTITTRPEGLLIPYWKACFVPSVELKSKFPFLFSSCGGSLRNDRQASTDLGGSTCRENVNNYELRLSHALFP